MDKVIIEEATTQSEFRRCFPMIVQLRTFLTENQFLTKIERMCEAGYHLVYARTAKELVGVLGYCIVEHLDWSRALFINDLVIDEICQGQQYGQILLNWALNYAKSQHCEAVHLDAGVTRYAAHKLYMTHDFVISGHHFKLQW